MHTCAHCGTTLASKRRRYCSTACYGAGKTKHGNRRPRPCEVCGTEYKPSHSTQRTCGRACGAKANPHYDRVRKPIEPRSSVVEWKPCRICQRWMSRPLLVLCSDDCRREDARRYAAATFVSQAKPTTLPCLICGRDYTTRTATNGGTCKRCQNRARKDDKRAERFGVQYERIDRLSVYWRDDWICQLCGDPVDRTAQAPHPLSASLDHIIPISRGGDHLYENVQCTHLGCNIAKGNRSPSVA